MGVVYALWLREVKRYLRSRPQIIASLGQPLMYLLVLGFGLGPVFARAGQGDYLRFVAPGVVGMTILFSSIFSGVGLLWDRQFGFLKETLVAPVPRLLVMAGRTLGGATNALMQGTAQLALFVGPVLAGTLIALLDGGQAAAAAGAVADRRGIGIAFAINACSFLISAITAALSMVPARSIAWPRISSPA